MKILISGTSGLVGQELQAFLMKQGHEVVKLVRKAEDKSLNAFYWDPEHFVIDLKAFEGVDTVINLAGENIAGGRWSEQRKQSILQSRLSATETLVAAMFKLTKPPAIFLSASAIGIYGERGAAWCTEETLPGSGFLAEVCKKWEAAASLLSAKGIRLVLMRFGIVLSPKGGALAKMMTPFKLGLGGKFGTGDQYMSWITLDDLVSAIDHLLTHADLNGPVNFVTPNPVTNEQFTNTLGKVLNRPAIFNVPAFILKLVLGKEMAKEFLLSSTRVVPKRLNEAGFSFRYPDLEQAILHCIAKS